MPRLMASLAIAVLFSTTSHAQDPARIRLEREAAGQAAQADKLFKAGEHAAALPLYRAERESRKTLGDARYEALALRGIGCCLAELGDEDGAIESFAAARDLDAGRDDKGFEGYDGLLLANAQLRKGEHAEALATLEKAIPKLDQAIDRDHECDARLSVVTAKLRLGQAEKARPDASRSIALAEELDDPRRLADAWLGSGLVDHELGRLGLALERIQDARDAYHEQDRPSDELAANRHLANLSYRLGHLARAARRFEEVIAMDVKLDDRASEAHDRLTLATIHIDLRSFPAAIREATRSRDGFSALGDDADQIEAMIVIAQGQSRTVGGLDGATTTINSAIILGEKANLDTPDEQVRLLLLSAELEQRLSRRDVVSGRIEQAKRLAATSRDQAVIASVTEARRRLIPGPK